MATYTVIGSRGTGNITSDQPIRNIIGELYNMRLGDKLSSAGLAVLLGSIDSGKKQVDNWKYECFEQESLSFSGYADGSHNTTTTTITFTGATEMYLQIQPGAELYVPSTGERMLVTAVQPAAKTATVVRDIAGIISGTGTEGTGATIATGAEIKLQGIARGQGTTYPDSISVNPVSSYNYTQIFKRTASVSGTLKATKLYGENNTLDYRTKIALIDCMREINATFWMGVRRTGTDPVTGKPMTLTGGALQHIQSNKQLVTDGTITMKVFDQFLERVAQNKPGGLFHMFGGLRMASCLDNIPRLAVRVDDAATSFGTNMREIKTNKGIIRFVLDSEIFSNDLAVYAPILDLDKVKQAYLNGRDLTMFPKVKGLEGHGSDEEVNLIQGELGLFMHGYGLDHPAATTAGAERSTHGLLYTTDTGGFNY